MFFLSYWKNFAGTEKRVRIIHGKRAIRVRAIEVILYICEHGRFTFRSWHIPANTQRHRNVVTTSLQRCCDVVFAGIYLDPANVPQRRYVAAALRRCSDVVMTLCVYWGISLSKTPPYIKIKNFVGLHRICVLKWENKHQRAQWDKTVKWN